MTRLSEALGGPNLWIKHDDCTGLASGGNKTRKLGMQSHIILEDRTGYTVDQYKRSGNVFLNHLYGASVSEVPKGTDMNAAMDTLAGKLKAKGRKPYIIPDGGSNAVGALGYVTCGLELMEQATTMGLGADPLVHATGSAGTQAGLVVGLYGARTQIPILGIGVRAAKQAQEQRVFGLAKETAELLGVPGSIARENVIANCDYVGPGYGLPTPGTIEAVTMTARLEGILLDPVYSGKGMAGLIDLCHKGHFKKGQNIVFLHTGGSVALYGYMHAFKDLSAR